MDDERNIMSERFLVVGKSDAAGAVARAWSSVGFYSSRRRRGHFPYNMLIGNLYLRLNDLIYEISLFLYNYLNS